MRVAKRRLLKSLAFSASAIFLVMLIFNKAGVLVLPGLPTTGVDVAVPFIIGYGIMLGVALRELL